jgi:23S rRNA pseudouridine2605 synthase
MPTNPKKSEDRPEGDRIAKLLARAGVASRREIERMIADKRITLDGKPVETPATFLTSLNGVSVDGKPVGPPEPTQLYAFHKPSGLITAERDPAGRATIYSALVNALPKGTPRVMPVGRLDFNTEGLLLLTNDGGLKRTMELPSSEIPRTYRARAFGEIAQEQLEALSEGVEIEGKNREVRRVLEFLGLEVNRLIRTAYGPFALGDLPRGQAARIKKGDLDRFVASLKRGKN